MADSMPLDPFRLVSVEGDDREAYDEFVATHYVMWLSKPNGDDDTHALYRIVGWMPDFTDDMWRSIAADYAERLEGGGWEAVDICTPISGPMRRIWQREINA